jgi:hypothetical protein
MSPRLGRAAGGIAMTLALLALAVVVSSAWRHPATRPLTGHVLATGALTERRRRFCTPLGPA